MQKRGSISLVIECLQCPCGLLILTASALVCHCMGLLTCLLERSLYNMYQQATAHPDIRLDLSRVFITLTFCFLLNLAAVTGLCIRKGGPCMVEGTISHFLLQGPI